MAACECITPRKATNGDENTAELFALGASEDNVGHVDDTKLIVRTFEWGGVPVNMQLDKGSPVSVITWPTYEEHSAVWPKLQDSPLKLTCFLEKRPVRGQLKLKVSLGERSVEVAPTVLGCSGPNLCGRDLIHAFNLLDTPMLSTATKGEPEASNFIDKVAASGMLEKFTKVFQPSLGIIKGPLAAYLQSRTDASPRFCKAHQVPYASCSKVEAEIGLLVDAGILALVPHPERAPLIVTVVKRNGSIRLRGDFKVTVNQACDGTVPTSSLRRYSGDVKQG